MVDVLGRVVEEPGDGVYFQVEIGDDGVTVAKIMHLPN
jgi:hypothetical protein